MQNVSCVPYSFFNFVLLLDYFFKRAGTGAARSSVHRRFSHTALFSVACPADCTLSLERSKSIQENLRTADFTCPCAGRPALVSSPYWEPVASAPRQGDTSSKARAVQPGHRGARSPAPPPKPTHSQQGGSRLYAPSRSVNR